MVSLVDDIETNIHIYIDADGDGNAEFDLIYDYENDEVLLYAYIDGAWSEVDLDADDRHDIDDERIEMGIEFSYLDILPGDTIKYYVTTEDDTTPGGAVNDRGPNNGWSANYTTIPEFEDLIIPAIGIMIMFIFFRRRARRQRRSKKLIDEGKENGG
jgi:hypothetical protein